MKAEKRLLHVESTKTKTKTYEHKFGTNDSCSRLMWTALCLPTTTSTTSAGVAPPTSQSHCSRSWLGPRSRGTAASSRKPPQAQQSWRPPTDDRGDETMTEICFCYSPS